MKSKVYEYLLLTWIPLQACGSVVPAVFVLLHSGLKGSVIFSFEGHFPLVLQINYRQR